MPRGDRNGRAARRAATGQDAAAGGDHSRLLRYSHIFASAVRDVLESNLLREVSSLPLTLSQFHLLKLMCLDGQHQAGEIADFLGVSPPAATKNIDKLERLGLLVRTRSSGDRRATLLSASPRTCRLVRRYEEVREERLRAVLDGFRPREIEQLSRLLERFAISLLRLDSSDEKGCLRCAAQIDGDCPVGRIHGGCPYLKLSVPEATSIGPKEIS